MEAGKGIVGKKEIQFNDLLGLGKGAISGIKKRGKAEVGDKRCWMRWCLRWTPSKKV